MFAIAIDSSHGLMYSGVASGKSYGFDSFYNSMIKIFSKNFVRPPFHWSKISRKVKVMARKDIIELINGSNINFNIFHHHKPKEELKKKYYLLYVPNAISHSLEHWLMNKYGSVEILVDDDYNISSVRDGTIHFIETLLSQLSMRLTGEKVAIRHENKIKAAIRQPNGSLLNFYAGKASSSSCKEIQIIDIVMGYYIENSAEFSKIFFRKI